MTKKQLSAVLILAVGFSLTASSVAAQARFGQRRSPAFMRGGQGGILFVLKAKQTELNITDEQLKKIKELMLTQEEKTLKHRNAQSELGLELRKVMMERENLNYDTLSQVLSQQSEIRNAMFIENLKGRDAIAAVLTPEQQQALNALRNDRPREGRRFMRDKDRRTNPRFNQFRKR